MGYDPSTKPKTKFFETDLGAIWEVFVEVEAEEASWRHLEVRSQTLQPLFLKMQRLYPPTLVTRAKGVLDYIV